jgi:malonyl-CoA/methylmalonyl-CoA synthetase
LSSHLTDYLAKHARLTPDKPAIVTGERSVTWGELWQEVQAGADFLSTQLSRPAPDSQQVIALLMPNTWECVVAYLSVVHLGHMAMPIDVIFKRLEIEAVLHQVPPALIITDDDGLPRLGSTSAPVINVSDFPAAVSGRDNDYLRLPVDEQVASLFFTSGTTGKPKVVPNTHRNHIWNIEACSKVWNWTNQDSQLISVRLSHMLGLVMGLSGTLYHGSTMYLQDRFSVEDTLKMLASGKITMFSHGPLVYSQLATASEAKEYDLSGVRLFISGSGPLPPTVWQRFKDVYGAEILEVYGTSETGRIASNLLDERIPGSPGRPLPEVDLKFSKDKEVLIKSPGVFPGYFHNSEATNDSKTQTGHWRTGDIGELVNGRLVLKGRMQERIRKQGYTVSPRDVEWALHKDNRIKEALVMGLQQPGEPNDKIIYFLVGDINEAEIREFCAANLPSVWRPDQIVILDSLPRTRSGKPELAKLRAMIN